MIADAFVDLSEPGEAFYCDPLVSTTRSSKHHDTSRIAAHVPSGGPETPFPRTSGQRHFLKPYCYVVLISSASRQMTLILDAGKYGLAAKDPKMRGTSFPQVGSWHWQRSYP
jgi:hypothetical protein